MAYPGPGPTLPPAPESHHSYTRTIDQPAAGMDWSFVPSPSDWARLLAITAKLTSTATSGSRYPVVTVTDETGNLITADIPAQEVDASSASVISWRVGSAQYGGTADDATVTSAIPPFWLPPGSIVAADTLNLDAGTPTVQASLTGSDPAIVPATIVVGVSDEFVWTGDGGGGSPVTYTIAPGVYATFATLQNAMNASLHSGQPFSTQARWHLDPTTGDPTLTAVADVGAAGNGDNAVDGANSAFAVIFGGPETFTLVDGADAQLGDQWTDIVATYVVAYHAYWETLDAMVAQFAAGR
jgi:hypothetical protein